MTPGWVDGAATLEQLERVHLWNEMLGLQQDMSSDEIDQHLREVCQDLCPYYEPMCVSREK